MFSLASSRLRIWSDFPYMVLVTTAFCNHWKQIGDLISSTNTCLFLAYIITIQQFFTIYEWSHPVANPWSNDWTWQRTFIFLIRFLLIPVTVFCNCLKTVLSFALSLINKKLHVNSATSSLPGATIKGRNFQMVYLSLLCGYKFDFTFVCVCLAENFEVAQLIS